MLLGLTPPKMSEQKGTQDEDLLDQLLATLGKLEVTDDNKEDQEKPEEVRDEKDQKSTSKATSFFIPLPFQPTSSKAKKKEQVL